MSQHTHQHVVGHRTSQQYLAEVGAVYFTRAEMAAWIPSRPAKFDDLGA
jgi:hypothetical protein